MPKMMIEVDVPDFDDPTELRKAIIAAYVDRELSRFAQVAVTGLSEGGSGNLRHVSDGLPADPAAAIREAAYKRAVATIEERVDAAIRDVCDAPFIPTNRWGERKGEPQTLREMVADTATKWFGEKVDANGSRSTYSRDTDKPRAEWLARKAVEEVFASTLKGWVEEVKKQVTTGIQARVTDEISATVIRLLAPR